MEASGCPSVSTAGGGRLDVGTGRATLAPTDPGGRVVPAGPARVLVGGGQPLAALAAVPVAVWRRSRWLFAEQERAPRGWDRGLHPGHGRPGWCRAGMCSARLGRVIGGGDKSCTDRPFPRTAERGYLKVCVGTLGGDGHVKPTIPGFGTAVARLRPADWQNSLPSDCDWLIGANVADHGRPGHPPQPSSDPAGQGSMSRGVLTRSWLLGVDRGTIGWFARQRSPR